MAQVPLEAHPLVHPALFAHVDDLVTGAALALRLVHRQLSAVQEILGEVVGLVRKGDTDAGGRVHLADRQDERLGECGADASGDGVHLCCFDEVLAQDGELVTGQARQSVGRSQLSPQSLGCGHQQLVTDPVAVRVVDKRELVQVGEENHCHGAGAAASKQSMFETFEQEDPVG